VLAHANAPRGSPPELSGIHVPECPVCGKRDSLPRTGTKLHRTVKGLQLNLEISSALLPLEQQKK
jgi:hypothetical protein